MSVNLLFPHRFSLCYGCFLIIIIYLLSIYSFCTRTKHKEPIKFCYAVESFQCSEVCMNLCYIILQNWEGVVSWENFYFKLRDESLYKIFGKLGQQFWSQMQIGVPKLIVFIIWVIYSWLSERTNLHFPEC